MVENRLGFLAGAVGSGLLAAIRRAKLPLLLRLGKFYDRCRALAGKPADIFVAGSWPADFPGPLCRRPSHCSDDRKARHRWNRIYVRYHHPFIDTNSRIVSLDSSTAFAMGCASPGLRSQCIEMANPYDLHHYSHLLFLASPIQRELGTRHWPSSKYCSGMALLGRILNSGAIRGLLADAYGIEVVEGRAGRSNFLITQFRNVLPVLSVY